MGLTGRFLCVLSSAVVLCFAAPTMAQKSKNTLRMPINLGTSAIDYYNDPSATENTWGPSFYDTLIDFDAEAGKFVPRLAKAWRHIDDKTIEFELRDDVHFHDGQKFNADDVVHIVNWLVDPKVVLRLKANWDHIKSAEKVDQFKLRIHLNQPMPFDLMRFAYGTYIYAEHVHSALERKETYGQAAVGTGPLRAVKIDKNTGIIAEPSKNYVHAGHTKPAAKIGRIVAEPIPDEGTRVAQLIANGADLIDGIDVLQAKTIAADPQFKLTIAQGLSFHYLAIPAQGRKNIPALADLRVRQAIGKALNISALEEIVYGGAKLPLKFEAVCWKVQIGCDYSKTTPAYDPEGARKLLAEAGFAGGFNVEMTTFAGITKQPAEAAANMLHQVGIRASVRPVPIPVARNLERDGKLQLTYYGWGGGGLYDSSGAMVRFFVREEFGDQKLSDMANATLSIADPKERMAMTAKVIDYAVENGYVFPTTSNPEVFVSRAELNVSSPVLRPNGPLASDFSWK